MFSKNVSELHPDWFNVHDSNKNILTKYDALQLTLCEKIISLAILQDQRETH
jgi:hypothetical protein